MPKTAADHHKLRHTSSWQMPNISWKAKVVIGLLGTLTLLQVVNAGWVWWERRRLSSLITRSRINPELAEALRRIKKVLHAFEKDVRDDMKLDAAKDSLPVAIVNMLVLNTIHERAAALEVPPEDGLKSKLLPEDEAIGMDAARYIRFASAAYGMLMLKGANVMSWDCGWPAVHKMSLQELNSWCIIKHCGVADEDLVKINIFQTRKLHLPAYIIVVDHATKSVVLSVRGTFSVEDAVTDLVCDSAAFMGGSCHRGLRQGAEFLLEDAKDDLVKTLSENAGYRLVLCGHSLGGGVSTLLTMMILHRRRDLGINRRTQILCYAFAPPPVFGPLNRVPAEAKKAIRSFVFRHDMVPRLSLANVYGLFRDLREVDTVGTSFPSRCKYLVRERMPHVSVEDDGLGARGLSVSLRYSTILHRTGFRGGTKSKQHHCTTTTTTTKINNSKPKSASRGETAVTNADADADADRTREEQDPLEHFVLRKLAEDFTADGRARLPSQKNAYRAERTAVLAHDMGRERYEKLIIPGSIFHLRKLGDIATAALAAEQDGVVAEGRRTPLYWMERESPAQLARILMVDTAIVDHLPNAYESALHNLYGDGLPKKNLVD